MCPSRWSFTKNHYMMHGQQNVKLKLSLCHMFRLSLNLLRRILGPLVGQNSQSCTGVGLGGLAKIQKCCTADLKVLNLNFLGKCLNDVIRNKLLKTNPQKYATLNQNCRDSQMCPVVLYSHSGLHATAFPVTHKIQSSYLGLWQTF